MCPVAVTTGSTIGQQLDTRLALRSMYPTLQASDQTNVDTVLGNFQMHDALAATAAAQYTLDTSTQNTLTASGTGTVLTFFQWLIQNGPAIVSFIESIIALFSTTPTPTPTPTPASKLVKALTSARA